MHAFWQTCSVVSMVALLALHAAGQSTSSSQLSQADRIYIASKVYSSLQVYFDHWEDKKDEDFDKGYKEYLSRILPDIDRKEFDLQTISFVAQLHNGHTWFDDRWLDDTFGGALGFYAKPVRGEWVVIRSQVPQLQVGDSIVAINSQPMEQFFEQKRAYLSDSNERAERGDLFATTYLLPQRFVIALSDGREVNIIRGQAADESQRPEGSVSGRWLEPERLAYIKIASFGGIEVEAAALKMVQEFRDAQGMIIDLRGNPGGYGRSPLQLQAALMTGPFRSWHESSGRISAPRGRSEIVSDELWERLEADMPLGIYKGRLVILIDGVCASFCEDFLMPFKDNHRATLIGQTTAGTFSYTYYFEFGNGMRMNIAATRESFPDGARFEGVGISPDLEIEPSIDDIRSHKDPVLVKAIEVLR